LNLPVTGSGKIDKATGPKPANLASACFSSRVAGRCSCSTVFKARMAARMSRAFAFSPLAMAGGKNAGDCGDSGRDKLGAGHDVISFSMRERPRYWGLTAREGISTSRERSVIASG